MHLTSTLTVSLASSLVSSAQAAPLASRVSSHYPGFAKLKSLFVFGDSYSRTGFDPSGTQPSSSNPLGNPTYPGRTSANGPNWVDLLTVKYNASSLLTYNFGASGATLDTSIVESGLDVAREISEYFVPYYANSSSDADPVWETDSTLVAIWVGINDINKSYLAQNESIHPLIFERYRELVGDLYDLGARSFLLLNVPPLERAPRTTGSSAAEERIPIERAAVKDYNSRVDALQEDLQGNYDDVTVFLYDTYSLFDKVIDDASQFEQTQGYKDTTSYCSAYQK
ncbi:SGNH/GDSL hydrolase family protein [Aspergillus melleus]|uniref:SGNH/GDSL hydrolase family protein n=1 Tax=Aspergillus melleus TaxID=138277 RepID=UPI001E8E95F4|nr:uncharacterized protein LDX57_001785 [Aspergillus melleus]KAH8424030.1 hypothetical protein LDX57_001785 [Aspergillus melleus]